MEFTATVTNVYKIEAKDRVEADERLTNYLNDEKHTGVVCQDETIVIEEVVSPPKVVSTSETCLNCVFAWKEDCSGDPALDDCCFQPRTPFI